MRFIHSLCVTCLIYTMAFSSSSLARSDRGQQHELVFGVLPFLAPLVLLKRFTPLKDYLEQVTGRDIFLESAPNFNVYAKRTKQQQYDILFTAPHYVPMSLEGGHYEIAAASNSLAAHIVVAQNSPLTSLSQLAGKRIAVGPKQAFVVIIARYMLINAGLRGEAAPIYKVYRSHNAALRALEYKDADAAVIGTYLLNKKKNVYRALAATPYYPGAAFLVSTKLPPAVREKISEAFINMPQSDEGKKTLALIKFPGFQKASPDKYAPLRAIVNSAQDMDMTIQVDE